MKKPQATQAPPARAPRAASQALRDVKMLTSMVRGLQALEDEVGDLANLERAKAAREAALSGVDAQFRARSDELAALEGRIAEAGSKAAAIITAAEQKAEAIASRAAEDRAQAARDLEHARADAARAVEDAQTAAAEFRSQANAALGDRDTVRRQIEAAEERLAAIKTEIAALRERMSV